MASGRRSGGGSRGRGGSPGCLLVLATLVVVLFLFLLNLGKIRQTISSTNFKDIMSTQRGTGAQPSAPAAPAPAADRGGRGAAPSSGPAARTAPSPAPQPVQVPPPSPGGPAASGAGGGAQPPAGSETAVPSSQGGENAAAQKAGAETPKARLTSLYFIRVDDDGVIVRQEVKRRLTVSDSPLTDALEALLKGPNEDELRKKLITLVPLGTKLLGVDVRGSTAFVNFSEDFMYNHYGIEGYAGQLKQIVYTATSFPTVQDVQILIDGERHDYLGGEGVFIGKPLSRNSF
ncbi:MAG: GerMN domain-containing protein [Rectinemataceae bacterium]